MLARRQILKSPNRAGERTDSRSGVVDAGSRRLSPDPSCESKADFQRCDLPTTVTAITLGYTAFDMATAGLMTRLPSSGFMLSAFCGLRCAGKRDFRGGEKNAETSGSRVSETKRSYKTPPIRGLCPTTTGNFRDPVAPSPAAVRALGNT